MYALLITFEVRILIFNTNVTLLLVSVHTRKCVQFMLCEIVYNVLYVV